MPKETLAPSMPGIKRVTVHALSLPVAIFTLVVVLFAALRFWKITTFSLWGGEAFTMIGVKQNWAGMLSYLIADIVHPPLFYILLKLWIALGGDSILWLKLFPVLSGIALVVPFYLLCYELGLQLPEISVALFLAAVNGYLIHYAQELRMYSLFAFLAMCSFWLFIRYLKTPGTAVRALIWLALVNFLAIYTHYYGWVAVGAEVLFLSIWQRRKLPAFGLSVAVLLMAFAPWAYLVIREAQSIGGLERNLDWIPTPDIADVLNFYSSINGPLGNRLLKSLGLLLFGLPLLLWCLKTVRSDFRSQRDEISAVSWLAILSFLPVIAIFLVSQRLPQAVWIDRYFIFIAVPYLILVAAAAYRLEPTWLRATSIALILLWSFFAGLNDLRTNRMAWASPQLGSRVKWDYLAAQMITAESDHSGPIHVYTLTVLSRGLRTGDWAISTSLDYFFELSGEDRFQFIYAKDAQAVLNQSPPEHFWVGFFQLAEAGQRSPAQTLAESGYRVGDAIVFQNQDNKVVLLPVWKE
jgi:hypothetical protein